jgi:5-methylthioadenosine/S-adenosylhomocysteine deaminase
MRTAGIKVRLGSDGEKENNSLDLLEEMKFAALLQKVSTLDPKSGDPGDVLQMATADGARALGLDHITGSLQVGKRADIITVDLRALHTTPLLHGANSNVAAHLVFSASGRDVDHVWVDGRLLVNGGKVLSANVAAIRARAQLAAEELFARRAALHLTRGTATIPAFLTHFRAGLGSGRAGDR